LKKYDKWTKVVKTIVEDSAESKIIKEAATAHAAKLGNDIMSIKGESAEKKAKRAALSKTKETIANFPFQRTDLKNHMKLNVFELHLRITTKIDDDLIILYQAGNPD
jgi:hypothetical protein